MSDIQFDSRGREILSDIPSSFYVPVQKSVSTLDFHRAKLLETREQMRRMIEEMRAESEYETFAEANDFAVEDPFDDFPEGTDFELADDGMDGLSSLAEKVHREAVAEATRQNMTASTETQSPPESGS